MITQDVYGNISYKDPIIPSRSTSLNAQQFAGAKKVGPYKKPVVKQEPTTANKPKSVVKPEFNLGDWLKSHYDQITSDPWAWASNNPWKAAGGIGALTALTSGIYNSGNNSNNRPSSFNLLNSLIPGLLVGGLVYGGIKAWPWLKKQLKSTEQFKQKVDNLVDGTSNLVNKANAKLQDAEILEDKIIHSKAGRLLFGKPQRSPILRDSKGNLHTNGKEVMYDATKGHFVYTDTRKRV
jgi:hypothetical protein